MKALDLFCGAGGASMGLSQAGFEVVGIDKVEFKEYPFPFYCMDVFTVDIDYMREFDFIWASPPCQAYSWGTAKVRNLGKVYPDLIGKTRELLLQVGKPFVIENVPGAPLRVDLMLCGEMFNLHVIRHRLFECEGFKPIQPIHKAHKNKIWKGTAVGVYSGGYHPCFWYNKDLQKIRLEHYKTVAGHNRGSLKEWQDAMGINWINNKKVLAQAVPPAYSKYIAEEFLRYKNFEWW